MRSAEEWAVAPCRKHGILIDGQIAYDVAETLRAYARECVEEARKSLEAVKGYPGGMNIMSQGLCQICNWPQGHKGGCPIPKVEAALRALPGETP